MRWLGLALSTYLAWLGVGTAAASDVEALRRFGLLGRVAVDCTQPYSQSNPYQIYAVSPRGAVTRTLRTGNPQYDATLSVRNVRMLTPDLLQFQESGRTHELIVTIVKLDGAFRNWNSTLANGSALIADGRFTDSGRPTVAFRSCGD
jgi:hypothetical protein